MTICFSDRTIECSRVNVFFCRRTAFHTIEGTDLEQTFQFGTSISNVRPNVVKLISNANDRFELMADMPWFKDDGTLGGKRSFAAGANSSHVWGAERSFAARIGNSCGTGNPDITRIKIQLFKAWIVTVVLRFPIRRPLFNLLGLRQESGRRLSDRRIFMVKKCRHCGGTFSDNVGTTA